MYVRNQTWIETGPRDLAGRSAMPVPVLLVPRSRGRRRGMGSTFNDWCASWSSLSDPLSAGLSEVLCLPNDVANVYTKVQYGKLPGGPSIPVKVGTDQPVTSANAPSTLQQMQGDWTPAQSVVTQEQQNQALAVQIQGAIDSGDYNPSGNLPVTAVGVSDFFSQYGTALLVGAALLGGVVLYSSVRR